MNRRALLQSAAILPISSIGGVREVRAGLIVDGSAPVHMIVTSHHSSKAAERFRRSWSGKVFESWGEWYVVGSDPRELPPHLAEMPGSLSHHDTLYGEAAEEQEYLVGAFRRERITCIVRIREDNELLILQIADHIAAQPVPGLFESGWSAAQLQRFIPITADLGVAVEESDDFWP